jgi:hypothetical protein
MLPSLVVIGVGNGLCFGPIMTVAVSNVGDERSGTSSGLVNVARMVGATLGVAIPGSTFGAHVIQASQDVTKFLAGMHRAFFIAGRSTTPCHPPLKVCARSFVGKASRDPRPPTQAYRKDPTCGR